MEIKNVLLKLTLNRAFISLLSSHFCPLTALLYEVINVTVVSTDGAISKKIYS